MRRLSITTAALLLLAACSSPGAAPSSDAAASPGASGGAGPVSIAWSTLGDYQVGLLTNSTADPVALTVTGSPSGGNLVVVPGSGTNGGRGVVFGQQGTLELELAVELPIAAEPCEPTFMQPAAAGEMLGSVAVPLDAEAGPVAAYVAVLDEAGTPLAIALNGGTRTMHLERDDAENVDLRVRAGSAPADPVAFACSTALVDFEPSP